MCLGLTLGVGKFCHEIFSENWFPSLSSLWLTIILHLEVGHFRISLAMLTCTLTLALHRCCLGNYSWDFMSPTSWLFWEGTILQHESQTSGLQSFRSPLLRLSLSLNVGSILWIETTEAGHPKASSLHFDSIDFSLIPLTSLDIFSPISECSFFQTLIFFSATHYF